MYPVPDPDPLDSDEADEDWMREHIQPMVGQAQRQTWPAWSRREAARVAPMLAAMNDHHDLADTEPELTVARTLDVRRADKDLDGAAAWIAGLIRQWPGTLVDLSDHGHHGNRIHIKIEGPE